MDIDNRLLDLIDFIKQECGDNANKLRKFDKRTRLVKNLIKNKIELLDRKQDGCLYLKTPYGCLRIFFQELNDGTVKIYYTQLCCENGTPILRKNLTK